MVARPDGIRDKAQSKGFWDRHSSPISLCILGSLLLAGLSGLLGGGPSPIMVADFPKAQLTAKLPTVLRNGQIFEFRFQIYAKSPLRNPTLTISRELWDDMTINTMLPAAQKETSTDGEVRLSYGPIATGEALDVKFDGQINPPLFGEAQGHIGLYDDDRFLGQMPVRIEVRP